MTAIMLNDGEIGAHGHGKCVHGSAAGEIAIRTTDAAGKIISVAIPAQVLRTGQRVESI
jgi:hypothetical protein